MQEGQLHGIHYHLYLLLQPAYIFVAHIGHFQKQQVFHFGAGQPLYDQAGIDIQQQRVARVERAIAKMFGQLHHPHIVGAAFHHGSPVREHLLEGDYLACGFHIAGGHDVERLVQKHFHPPPDRAYFLEAGGDSHLAASAIHIHRVVFVHCQHGGVFGWGLAQLF